MGSHIVMMDNPGDVSDEQEWTGTKNENAFAVDDFDKAPDDLSRVKKHELNGFFAFLGSKLLFVQEFSCANVGKIGSHSSQN